MMRRSKISLSTTFLVCLILVGMLSVLCVGFLWIHTKQAEFSEESHNLRESYLASRKVVLKREVERALAFAEYMKSQTETRLKATIRDRVNEAHAIAMNLSTRNKDIPRTELGALIKEALRPVRFNKGRGYYFAFDMDGIETLFADRPEMEGKNMLGVRGGKGEFVVADMLALVRRQGEGFYSYTWSKPNEKGKFPKIAFVRYFEPLDWVIGTGEYLDDVEIDIQQEVLQWIGKITFEDNGYIFAGQWDGLSLSGPDAGRNLLEVADLNGAKVVRRIIAAAESGGGYVSYVFPGLGERPKTPKLIYALGIEDWQWYLAAGLDGDDIEAVIAQKQVQLDEQVHRHLFYVAMVLASILAAVLTAVRIISGRIGGNLASMTSFLTGAASTNTRIDHNALHFSEFAGLAVSVNEMVEKRVQAENALKESQAWSRTILNAIPSGVMVIDVSGRTITDINQAALKMVGAQRDKIIGYPCHRFLCPCPSDENNCPIIDKGKQMEQSEGALTREDGRTIPVLKSCNRLRVGEKEYVIETFSDLSGQRELEEQLRQSHKMEALGLLAGGVAHDLNNRLSPVIGFCELLLEDDDLNADQSQQLDQILDAGLKARDLVHQLLTFGRKQALSINTFEINALISSMELLLRRTIPENITIEFVLDPVNPAINADAGQIEQVILNLTLNSRDSMPDGGRLIMETRQVFLDENDPKIQEGLSPGRYVQIVISDTGCGIDPDNLPRIFDPFFTTKEKGRGTGLGLSMVYGIVKQHGGSIRVTSARDKGSSFKVYLPIARVRPDARPGSHPANEDLRGNETVMVVEDDEMVRILACTILKKHGYKVLSASGALECLDQLETLEGRLDLVLTDVVMPHVNGKELFDRIQASFNCARVLFMSGYTDRIIAHHGVLEDGLHFIQKPFTTQGLVRKVREVLDGVDCTGLN